ncbi:hypothetical protein P3S68_013713 [Capsicum galapagoense]
MNSGLAYITQTRSFQCLTYIGHLHENSWKLLTSKEGSEFQNLVETLSREKLASRLTLTADAASVGPPLLPSKWCG